MATIAVSQIEYVEGGRAIWIHSPDGVTVMRIHCTGQVKVLERDSFKYPNADLNVTGDITIGMPLEGK